MGCMLGGPASLCLIEPVSRAYFSSSLWKHFYWGLGILGQWKPGLPVVSRAGLRHICPFCHVSLPAYAHLSPCWYLRALALPSGHRSHCHSQPGFPPGSCSQPASSILIVRHQGPARVGPALPLKDIVLECTLSTTLSFCLSLEGTVDNN